MYVQEFFSLYVLYLNAYTYVSSIVRYINKCKDKFENTNVQYNTECVLHILNENFNDIKFALQLS